ncbi:MAG: deoxyribonuclease IV [Erysipelotrichaceae bacterium]
MRIGCHCSMSAPDYVLGSVKEALSYNANALMIYTGAPQNSARRNINELKIEEANKFLADNNLNPSDVVIHAPYIINLANTFKVETYELGVKLLINEINRSIAIGSKILVLHPGSHVGASIDTGINSIIKGIDSAIASIPLIGDFKIALETMSGKGTEVGFTFEQLKKIIEGSSYTDNLGVCMDSCHLSDAGYDITNINKLLDEFESYIPLNKILCFHINDSKNPNGSKKDRHANIGYGTIGFQPLSDIVNCERLKDVIKILETPYIDGQAPYAYEIKMLKENKFNDKLIEELTK